MEVDLTLSSNSSGSKTSRPQLIREELNHIGHADGKPLSAICLSGGGIRSAAFCLGVLQALARRSVLTNFQYLSTVSGGGYTGSWLRSQLAGLGASKLEERLGSTSPELLRELRVQAARYLTPQPGIWSLDVWRLVGTYIRNLLLNWCVLAPFAVAVAASVQAVPRLIGDAVITSFPALTAGLARIPGGIELLVVVGPLAAIAVIGLAVSLVRAIQRCSRGVGGGAIWLRGAVLWLIASGSVVYGPDVLGALSSAVLSAGAGFTTALAALALDNTGRIVSMFDRFRHIACSMLIRLTAAVFVLSLIVFFSSAAHFFAEFFAQDALEVGATAYVYVAVAALAVSSLFAWAVDPNAYSLHGLYRDRLARGFLEDQDKPLEKLASPDIPFHVINATLNTSKSSLADRKGLPFSFTPLRYGYWKEDLTPRFSKNGTSPHTLSTAMAISGAAANPNMGYFSSALLRFPMALLNMRLGWWVDLHGTRTIGTNPLSTWRVWKSEFLGVGSHEDEKLVNVSDGGHFDNLGLYEMVRRRCTHILVVDAGCDPRREYRDLANAVRRIRIDFGVEITLSGLDLSRDSGDTQVARPVYKGTIRYSLIDPALEDGTLVYVRPEPHPHEPIDVGDYRRRHPAFPHEPTADQWFSEEQFESYRRLGQFTLDDVISFYLSDKGPSARPNPLDSPHDTVLVLAEAAYRMSQQVTLPTHAGGILYSRSGGEVSIVLVRSVANTTWVLPKGHIEEGESSEYAAKREVAEEAGYLNLQCTPFGIESFTRDDKKVVTAYFLMDTRGQSPKVSEEERGLLRLTFGHDAFSADSWKSGAWEAVPDATAEWRQIPDDVQALLRRVVHHLA